METTVIVGIIWGLYRDYRVYLYIYMYIWDHIGIMEKKMETTI